MGIGKWKGRGKMDGKKIELLELKWGDDWRRKKRWR